MLLYQLAKVALAAAILIGQSVTANNQCSKISVRREWRTLAPHERKEWMTAVKVKHSTGHSPRITDTSIVSQRTTPQFFSGANL